jgi:hypothetical protein
MKNTLAIFLLLITAMAFGQTTPASQPKKENAPTKSFLIFGDVKGTMTVELADLKKYKEVAIGDVAISNHLGEKKSELKGLKGVLLTDILSTIELNAENPKVLSEYYYICKANDGYTVVYSWNELFNTAVGNSVYIVTENEGKPAATLDGSIMMISPKDAKTGRRNLKSLMIIEAKRAK